MLEAGIPVLHIRCVESGLSIDSWFDRVGLVLEMLLIESPPDTPIEVETRWEVVALDVEPTGPLPPRP